MLSENKNGSLATSASCVVLYLVGRVEEIENASLLQSELSGCLSLVVIQSLHCWFLWRCLHLTRHGLQNVIKISDDSHIIATELWTWFRMGTGSGIPCTFCSVPPGN